MDNSDPYRAPFSAIAPVRKTGPVHWRAVLSYGAILFASDVLIGMFEPRSSVLGGFWAALVLQSIIFGFFTYRLPFRPLVHCLLAICFEYLLSWVCFHALNYYNLTSPPIPLLLEVIYWAITGLALVAGLLIGLLLRRLRAGPNNSSKPTPLRGAA